MCVCVGGEGSRGIVVAISGMKEECAVIFFFCLLHTFGCSVAGIH